MKPLKLKVKGLNSFIEEQVIDFEKLTQKGLFGIFGPTGSGKSTILDGITLALYGEMSRKSSNYINTNVDTMEVSFEFQISSAQVKKYRVTRDFKRDKSGSIHTKLARIIDITEEQEIILEEQVRQVNNKCHEIIGLNIDDFTRTVVLPQGKFSEFLKLQGKERREMLERLFNLEKYGDELSQKLYNEINKYRHEESEMSGQLKSYEDVNKELIDEKEIQVRTIKEEQERMNIEKAKMEETYSKSKTLWSLQLELNKYMEDMNTLEEQRQEVKGWNEKVQLGQKALRVLPYIQNFDKKIEDIKNEKKKNDELSNQLKSIESKRAEILEKYDKAYKSKEEELPVLQELQFKLQDGLAIEEALEVLYKEKEVLTREFEENTQKLEEKQKKKESLQKKVKETNDQIVQKELELEEVNTPHEYVEQLRMAFSIDQKIDELKAAKIQTENELIGILKDMDDTKREYDSLKKEIEEQEKSLIEQNEKLGFLTQSPPGDDECLLISSNQLNDYKNKWKMYSDYSLAIKNQEEEIKNYEKELEEKKNKKIVLEEEFTLLNENINQLKTENIALSLRENLKEGDSCPVCGSTMHNIEVGDSSRINVKKLEESLKEKSDLIHSLSAQIAKAEGEMGLENKNILKIKRDLESLGEDFLEHPIEILEENFKKLQENIQKYKEEKDKLEQNIQTITKKNTEKQITFSASVERLNNYSIQKTQILAQLETIKKELHENQEALENFQKSLQILDVKKEMHEINEKEKKKNDLQNQLKILRERLKVDQEQEGILIKVESDLHRICTQKSSDLKGVEKSIEEKKNSLLSKLGQISDISKELEKTKEKIEKIKKDFETSQNQKEKNDIAFSQYSEKLNISNSYLLSMEKELQEVQESLKVKLCEENFVTVEEVRDCSLTLEEINKLQKSIDKFNNDFNQLSGAVNRILRNMNGKNISQEDYEKIQEDWEKINTQEKELETNRISFENELNNIKRRLNEKKNIEKEKRKTDEKLGLLRDLEKLFKGKRFVEYVASYQLQYVSLEASEKLKWITRGNYGLEVDEKGKFIIRDYKNGGAMRDASTLSGGETFLASLALALSLSAQIQLKGTAPLEFFFLDEGFGTLDDEVLEVVMDCLERIHHEKLSIGIISHVESIKNRVPVKLLIEPAKAGLGGSKVIIEYS
ncbi:exonuclease SbcC [Alkalibaculum bacchi]|mgnify:FL=1|uniref:Nuclease SbcCD subunit C n=2 Tax=Alkalibaculum bacchi TaxID=645887 RepID=A0A366I6T4_9FIRM|nr:AAA family ATPase [Alkalibaculum bacchi]RBP64504.1 exonuclease SbcC [Alkalibaculum bacchi]